MFRGVGTSGQVGTKLVTCWLPQWRPKLSRVWPDIKECSCKPITTHKTKEQTNVQTNVRNHTGNMETPNLHPHETI